MKLKQFMGSVPIVNTTAIMSAAALGAVAAVIDKPWILAPGGIVIAAYMWLVRFKRD